MISAKQDLKNYVYEGLKSGNLSDITIEAHGKTHKLHKFILGRSGYFQSLFSGSWKDSEGTHQLTFEDVSKYITEISFNHCIWYLYGLSINYPVGVEKDPLYACKIFCTAQFLDIESLIDSSHKFISDSLRISNHLDIFIEFVSESDYGSLTTSLHDKITSILCLSGWEAEIDIWAGIPPTLVQTVINSPCFFVPNEWERILFAFRLCHFYHKNPSNRFSWYAYRSIFESYLLHQVYYSNLTPEQLYLLDEYTQSPQFLKLEIPNMCDLLKRSLWDLVTIKKKIKYFETSSNSVFSRKMPMIEEGGFRNSYREGLFPVCQKDDILCGSPDYLSKTIFEMEKEHSLKSASSFGTYDASEIPPLRFSVLFTSLDTLQYGKRLFSKTLWYRGSYWNVYVQKTLVEYSTTQDTPSKHDEILISPDFIGQNTPPIPATFVSKKATACQVGIYIHRASKPTPPPSTLINRDIFEKSNKYIAPEMSQSNILPNEPKVQMKAKLTSELGKLDITSGNNVNQTSELIHYEDGRSIIQCYFSLYIPSGKSENGDINYFHQRPCSFSKSQSLGWKCNTLMAIDSATGRLQNGKDPNLKVMVVFGLT
ncbi:hypothetical protein CAAN1_15S02388 [[Candida] anglica]|uniref:BTB domain-containing protein n=1 Tax=[Candida] anglica TaxID=148631 RepID=A0ABP0E859_9ASCO